MNWSIALGIAGIIITLLIYYLQRILKYPGRLSTSLISLYRVLGEKPEHYSALSLNYGDYQIEKNLLYLRFLIFNERSYDIKADDLDSRIMVSLPENVQWVDVRVAKQSEHVGASINIVATERSKASIGFNLLRNGESVLFEGLVETEEDQIKGSLFEQMRFSHRIPNVDSFEKVTCPHDNYRGHSRFRFRSIITYILFIGALLAFDFAYKDTIPLQYFDKANDKRVSLALNKNGEIVAYPEMFSRRNSYTVSMETYSTSIIPDRTYHRNYTRLFSLIMIGMLILMIVLLEWEEVSDKRRRKRIAKYL